MAGKRRTSCNQKNGNYKIFPKKMNKQIDRDLETEREKRTNLDIL